MNKVRSNALWNELSCEQRIALDKWLFEEKLGYQVVWQRAQAQFRYKGSKSSVRRYFYRRRKEQTVEEFKDLREELVAINGAPADPSALRLASMKLMGTFLFQQLRRSPENVKEVISLAKLMVQNDYNEILRETKDEEFNLRRELKAKDHEIRREALEFAKDKYQCDMIEKGVKALPHLQKVAATMEDPDPTRYREAADEARDAMFGPAEQTPQEDADKKAPEGKDAEPSK